MQSHTLNLEAQLKPGKRYGWLMLKFFSLLIFTVMTTGDGLGQDLVHPETVR
jgi:hypothetical protein